MAERLTRKSMAGNFFIPHGINIYDVYAKLAFYEDSGLTSAEVFELAKAKAEGRLVVLPFQKGTKLFYIDKNSNPNTVQEFIFMSMFENLYLGAADLTLNEFVFSNEIFLSREEAESALKK